VCTLTFIQVAPDFHKDTEGASPVTCAFNLTSAEPAVGKGTIAFGAAEFRTDP
jgi:hypothetical protein